MVCAEDCRGKSVFAPVFVFSFNTDGYIGVSELGDEMR